MDFCLVSGCGRAAGQGGFCIRCWKRIPVAMQQRLFATFQKERPGPDYYQTVRDAVQVVKAAGSLE